MSLGKFLKKAKRLAPRLPRIPLPKLPVQQLLRGGQRLRSQVTGTLSSALQMIPWPGKTYSSVQMSDGSAAPPPDDFEAQEVRDLPRRGVSPAVARVNSNDRIMLVLGALSVLIALISLFRRKS